MLYLAEVKKQSKGFIGGSETKIKLLAFQRNDQSWTAVPGEEMIVAEEASSFGDGTLVMVNLGGNRQLQGKPELAGGRLVTILQNFSRVLDKSKDKEEEIEQWKQSLTYQSQELNRREMELEARLEQIEEKSREVEVLAQQSQKIEREKAEAARLKKELEGAWEHLRGEQRRLEERKEELSRSNVLDEEQALKLRELIARISSALMPADTIKEQLQWSWDTVNAQQVNLDKHWQQLEQQKKDVDRQQAEINAQKEKLQSRKEQFKLEVDSLEQVKSELQLQRSILKNKQELLQTIAWNFQNQEKLYELTSRLAIDSGSLLLDSKVDVQALESMPLGELEGIVANLQGELEKFGRFTKEQEDELTLQHQEVEELRQKIERAGEFDRFDLETELEEAQDQYQILDRSLSGSRRNLLERQGILKQHIKILRARQGIVDSETMSDRVNLGPLLHQIEESKQQQEEDKEKLENQLEQFQNNIRHLEETIKQKAAEQETKKREIEEEEEKYQQAKTNLIQIQSQVNIYQETLQPLQDNLNQIREKFGALEQLLNRVAEGGERQAQAFVEMEKMMSALTGIPQIEVV